jgi:ankyrin repeat protein
MAISSSNASHMLIFNAISTVNRESLMRYIRDDPNCLSYVDNNGYTPLILACSKGLPWITQELIEAGADVNARVEGTLETALHLVCNVI